MQFIVQNGIVECPACGLQLTKVKEQDKRVHVMRHPSTALCSCGGKLLRVDRLNGYGELQNYA